uniref:Insulinase family protein n=1 Tax=candidate division WOR-3 bacterium TaxID=2052148 RepID=A0A7C3UN88_UNCW3
MIRQELINGIRVIQEDFPFLPSAACGIIFNLGSRDEEKEKSGITHFIEHSLFKGTTKKTAREISLRAESLGAHIDGFTARESTGLYARFLKEFTEEVLELLFEIAFSPLFPEEEIEKEKGVIYQEIREIEEDPEEKVFSLLFESLFPSHPLGLPITGYFETVKNLSRETIRTYFHQNYTTERTILILIGSEKALPLDRKLLNEAGGRDSGRKRSPPAALRSGEMDQKEIRVVRRKELESVYLIAGQTFPVAKEKRYSLSVFNTAFGGSLSSRLFQRLREEEGLVYQISSFVDLYSDCGIFGIYFVTSKENALKALKIVSEVREECRTEGFNQKEIDVALNLTKSSIILSQESPLHRMFALAKTQLLFGEILTLKEVLSNYQKVKLEEVNLRAEEILTPPQVIVGVGDLKEEDLKNFLS